MSFGPDSYRKAVLKLLPSGLAWAKEKGDLIYELADSIAQEFSRISGRALRLIEESDPRTTFELIKEWETTTGLPDECAGPAQTLLDRRNAIIAVLTADGGITPQFYIDLAAHYGFIITITEFKEFKAGLSHAGDPLSNGAWVFTWMVNAPLDTVLHFLAGSGSAGDPLSVWGNGILECVITKRNPAGTIVLFSYN